MSRDEVQLAVRQRDRFQCQYPNCEKAGEQYAHIVAEDDGGTYDLGNLIYLCYEHHNRWQETARASLETKARLQAISVALRDNLRPDSVISSALDFPAGEELAAVFGGGFRIVNCPNVLEGNDPDDPYLAISVDKFGILQVNARFEDPNGGDFMRVSDNRMTIHTASAWDIILKRRFVGFENAERDIRLNLRQSEDLSLHITGRLFLNGGFFSIEDDRVRDETSNNTWINCRAGNGKGGITFAATQFPL